MSYSAILNFLTINLLKSRDFPIQKKVFQFNVTFQSKVNMLHGFLPLTHVCINCRKVVMNAWNVVFNFSSLYPGIF